MGNKNARECRDIEDLYSTLVSLSLAGNSIESSGAQALAEALRMNSTLMILELRNNSIRDNGAQALHQVSLSKDV